MTLADRALRRMILNALGQHALPWTVEQDWTWEVIAKDTFIVAKCQTREEADYIVWVAQEIKRGIDELPG